MNLLGSLTADLRDLLWTSFFGLAQLTSTTLGQLCEVTNTDRRTPMTCEIPIRYSADISAGGLKVPESRIIAGLLLRGLGDEDWKQALTTENVLQARNPATSIRLARLIRARLSLMDVEFCRMIYEGTGIAVVHAALAAAIKHSRLLGDFLDLVVREQYRLFNPTLSRKLWDDYLSDCRGRDPEMPEWNESTRRRLRSSVFQALAQAGFIESTKTLKLRHVHIAPEVLRYLSIRDEEYVLRCIQVSS